jgi:hypothetical protein
MIDIPHRKCNIYTLSLQCFLKYEVYFAALVLLEYSVEDVAIEKYKKEMSEQNISELETKDTDDTSDADNNNLDLVLHQYSLHLHSHLFHHYQL